MFLCLTAQKIDSRHLQTLMAQTLINWGNPLHITRILMVPILSLAEPLDRCSECLFEAHRLYCKLMKYTVSS